ncbi:MAG TPA: TrmH family RNA methyltransferase [Geminicoccaceae bacterium]|jgi:tRNA (cytidine/uridine-2'-O-)-methyltransferase|nr:TrmH family RNA methyltransferase [Geminicoccaceae bacterium]
MTAAAVITATTTTQGRVRLALFEPDQPGNFGAVLRLGACLGVAVDVIEPCGFPLDERRIRRAAMDYATQVVWRRHAGLGEFLAVAAEEARRLVLLSTRASTAYHAFAYRPRDVLVLGSESRGASPALRAACARAVRIPIRPELRSLNLATAAAIGLAEALRQLGAWPGAMAGSNEGTDVDHRA